MGMKKKLMKEGMKLMSDPRMMKLMQDERFMKVVMAAMSIPGQVSTIAQDQTDRFARMMSLATEQEVRDLRRTVRALEEQLAEMKKREDSKSG